MKEYANPYRYAKSHRTMGRELELVIGNYKDSYKKMPKFYTQILNHIQVSVDKWSRCEEF